MTDESLRTTIEALWDARDTINSGTKGAPREAVEQALAMLEAGTARVAEPDGEHHRGLDPGRRRELGHLALAARGAEGLQGGGQPAVERLVHRFRARRHQRALGTLGDADDDGVRAQRGSGGSAQSQCSHGIGVPLPSSSSALFGRWVGRPGPLHRRLPAVGPARLGVRAAAACRAYAADPTARPTRQTVAAISDSAPKTSPVTPPSRRRQRRSSHSAAPSPASAAG